MAGKSIDPKDVARFAAQGVAMALQARDPDWIGPTHIICGYPPFILYDATLAISPDGNVGITVVEMPAPR